MKYYVMYAMFILFTWAMAALAEGANEDYDEEDIVSHLVYFIGGLLWPLLTIFTIFTYCFTKLCNYSHKKKK